VHNKAQQLVTRHETSKPSAGDALVYSSNTNTIHTMPAKASIAICVRCSMDNATVSCQFCTAQYHTWCLGYVHDTQEPSFRVVCELCREEKRTPLEKKRCDMACMSCNQACLIDCDTETVQPAEEMAEEDLNAMAEEDLNESDQNEPILEESEQNEPISDESDQNEPSSENIQCVQCGSRYCWNCACIWKNRAKITGWRCFACSGINDYDKMIAKHLAQLAGQVTSNMKKYTRRVWIPKHVTNIWDQFGRAMLNLQEGCCFKLFERYLELLLKLCWFQVHKRFNGMFVPSVVPYQLCSIFGMHEKANAELLRLVSTVYARQAAPSPEVPLPLSIKTDSDEQKTRIAYASSDIRNHACWHLLREAMMQHSKFFQIFIYSMPPIGMNVLHDLTMAGINFLVIEHPCTVLDSRKADSQFVITNFRQDTSPRDIALQVHADSIDIYVDLNGHTLNNFIGVSSLRPASYHLAFLGYPGPIEGGFDYVVADRIVLQGIQHKQMVEKAIFLDCCQPNSMRTIHNEMQTGPYAGVIGRPLLSDFGFPLSSFIFAYLGRLGRLTTELVLCWKEILEQTPESFIMLRQEPPLAVPRIKALMVLLGINLQRVIFIPSLPTHLYLAVLKHCDVVLDSRPYSLHTCCSDALGVGTPVVALMEADACWAGRVSGSLVFHAMGNDELIAKSLEEYVSKAVNLFRNPELLRKYRAVLEKARQQGTGIFNSGAFIHSLEAAFSMLMKHQSIGYLSDDDIDVVCI